MGQGNSTTTTTSPSASTTNGSSAPWSAQQPYLLGAFQDAQNNYNNDTANPYTGQFAAGPVSQQYDAAGNAISTATGADQTSVNGMIPQGAANAASGFDAANQASSDLGAFSGINTTANNVAGAQGYAAGANVPAQVQAATALADQNASENAIPNLYRADAASGNINSDRSALAQGVVERGLAQNEQSLDATLNNNNYEAGIGQNSTANAQDLQADSQLGSLGSSIGQAGVNEQTGAINTQGAVNNQDTSGATALQTLAQSGDTAALQNYLGPMNLSNQQLTSLMAIIGGNNWGSQTSSSTLNTGGTSTAQQNPSIMSQIGSGVGIAGSLISDRRLKTDIKLVGRLDNGLPVYSYRYVFGGPTQIGLMAQDVEKIAPDAVKEVCGIKSVDYDLAVKAAPAGP